MWYNKRLYKKEGRKKYNSYCIFEKKKKFNMMTTLVSMTALRAMLYKRNIHVKWAIWRCVNPDGHSSSMAHSYCIKKTKCIPICIFRMNNTTTIKKRREESNVRNNTSSHYHFSAIMQQFIWIHQIYIRKRSSKMVKTKQMTPYPIISMLFFYES